MKRSELIGILFLVACWGLGGYLCVSALFMDAERVAQNVGFIGAMVNIIIGLLLLLLVTRDPDRARRLFLQLQQDEERAGADVAIFWALTITVPLISLFVWLGTLIIRWLFRH